MKYKYLSFVWLCWFKLILLESVAIKFLNNYDLKQEIICCDIIRYRHVLLHFRETLILIVGGVVGFALDLITNYCIFVQTNISAGSLHDFVMIR